MRATAGVSRDQAGVRARRLVFARAASAALLLVAAFAVHQLRYLLAYGGGASREADPVGSSNGGLRCAPPLGRTSSSS